MTREEFKYILTKKDVLFTENGSYICEKLRYRYDAKNGMVQVIGKIPYSFIANLKKEKRIISLPGKSYITNEQMLDYIMQSDSHLWYEKMITLKKMRDYYISYYPDKIYYSLIMIEDVLGLMIWLSEWNKFIKKKEEGHEKKLLKEQ